MISTIIDLCAKNRLFVILISIGLCLIADQILNRIKLDALPDLSDTQVILYVKWERPPAVIEYQVTYPIITSLLGTPRVKAIRGFSDFGYAFIYVIFQDNTDLYWARARVLEYISSIKSSLPKEAEVKLGPDATGLGWVFQYALKDVSGKYSPDYLRTFQDFKLKYILQSVQGVAEVASFGGFVKQYQVIVDPQRLASLNISLEAVIDAIRDSNNETGGRLIEFSGTEYMVVGRGYAKSKKEFEDAVVKVGQDGVPILVKDIARVELGPEIRRGIGDLNGKGDVVGGIVIMRDGENAERVIERVKGKLQEVKPSLPEGTEIQITYDRSDLIRRAIDTLKDELILEMIIVSLVILFFLWHIPSAIVPILTIPISVLLAFIPLYLMGITVNIMSLAGIAISIGVLVDGAIVEVENAYHKINLWIQGGKKAPFYDVRLSALKEVGPSVFFSLLVIAVAFIPVFALEAQEGRLFKPLAWSKNLTMALAAILAITLDPAIRMLFSRAEPFTFRPHFLATLVNKVAVGTYVDEEHHPITKRMIKWYKPICSIAIRRPKLTVLLAFLAVGSTIPFYFRLGSEFMPPLNEGTILYMPTTLPGISVTEAMKVLQVQDRILSSFPEVESVHGKAGRADTPTDPAPLSMMETVVVLKPRAEWRLKERWYSSWAPEWLKKVLFPFWPDRISFQELINEMDKALQIPGITNAWTMPIKARIDMLTTGVRTAVGIKVMGDDLAEIEKVAVKIEEILKSVKGTRSIFAERTTVGYYVDIIPRRDALARYGLTINDVHKTITHAIGGEVVTLTIEGKARFPVNVRYPPELRDDIDKLKRVFVQIPNGSVIPLGLVADIETVQGPAMIRNENGFLCGYVFVDIVDRDVGGWVEEAKATLEEKLDLPSGMILEWSGQWENMERVKETLKMVVPIVIGLIIMLLYANTKSFMKTVIVLLAIPFSAIGAIFLFYVFDFNLSIAAWIGMIALMGLDAETGVFMLLFLDVSLKTAKKEGKLNSEADLDHAIIYGAVKRIRPKAMTVLTAFMGLLPIMWSTGAGADMMRRIAGPMIGGLITSFIGELVVYPALYKLWQRRGILKHEK